MSRKLPEVKSQFSNQLPADIEDRFLAELRKHGTVALAALNLGVTRQTMYARRKVDEAFAAKWLEALEDFKEDYLQRVLLSGYTLGAGELVPMLDENGQPVLNEDGTPQYKMGVEGVDIRVMLKLLDKSMKSEDGPAVTNVQVNNTLPNLPSVPRLLDLSEVEELSVPETITYVPELSEADEDWLK